ncbi:MAG: hypothetical protein KDA31_04000 [Phycisphaerales bacterium]|nr:hypothetical protein [Phycisphaerales bacterium]MCB9835506.1 hypothetical protein [Phycisphaera sp.]
MSAKWRRVQAWDRENLTGPLTPVRYVLHALSSITLAAFLLVGVALYAVLASVPVGLLALIPTWILYILSLLLVSVLPGAITFVLAGRVASGKNMARAPSFLLKVGSFVIVTAAGVFVWVDFVWPAVRYEPATHEGLRLFASFVERYASTTIRRLPAFEMTELEFYAWWPMRAMLMLFTLNLIVATIRRIEFKFVNLGVLTVHTGIVLIALGSVYYQMFKQEGDALLLAGGALQGQIGTGPGPAQAAFYDREDPALWIHAGMDWQQRRIKDLPRYNDYSLNAFTGETIHDLVAPQNEETDAPERTLSVDLNTTRPLTGTDDLSFKVVGFASYAEQSQRWQRVEPARPEGQRQPMRLVYLVAHDLAGTGEPDEEGRRMLWFALAPGDAVSMMHETPEIAVEYAIGMDPERWNDLKTQLPIGAPAGLVVEIPEANYKSVMSPRVGERTPVGNTGWHLTLQQIAPEPPFPIVTPGYEGAKSSIAFVRLEPPLGEPFVRWVYHRFPEISQDLLEQASADGRPMRRDPDRRVRVGFVDATKLQVYFNEDAATGLVDAIVRTPGGVEVREGLAPGSRLREPVPRLSFDLADRWDDARQVEVPVVVPEEQRDGTMVGTYDKAMIAVEVAQQSSGWSEVVWLPFCKYTDVTSLRASSQRALDLPDGRRISLVFGRVQHRLPGFQLRMLDFKMLSYDHRGSPRDYQTLVRVESTDGSFESYDHVTRLNAPLKAPFLWSSARGFAANFVGEIVSHLSPRQYKFSQAGWDRSGWEQSQQLVDQGVIERPRANFTILGVGNNPGIHVIALGGVLMGVGTPWAFYIKPWLLRRQRDKLKAQHADQTQSKQQEAAPKDALEGSLS